MELAQKLPKIKDQEREGIFGYVFAVSGPGKLSDITDITHVGNWEKITLMVSIIPLCLLCIILCFSCYCREYEWICYV
mgnify:CR=1 FL=1